MQTLVFENGNGVTVDLTSGNFCVVDWSGLSETSLNIQTQQVPFNDGSVFLDALYEDREITIKLAVNDNGDLATRYELKRQLIALMNAKAGEGVLTYTNDYISKQIKAIPQLPIFENKNLNDSGTLKCTLVWNCCGVYWEDTEDTEVEIDKVSTIIENNGDVPVQIKAKIEQDNTSNTMLNPTLFNYTSGQSIGYEGEIEETFYIDTELGEKKFYQKKLTCNTLLSGSTSAQIVKSDYYRAFYVLQGDEVLKSTDGTTFTSIYQSSDIEGDYIYAEDCLIIIYGRNKLFISYDGENFITHTINDDSATYVSDVACKVSGTTFYLVFVGEYNYYCTGNITSQTLGSFSEITLPIENYSIYGLVYNPYLDKFIIIAWAIGVGGCYSSSNGSSWEYLGRPHTIAQKIKYIPATRTMIHYGGQYGYLETSVDGVTWEEKDPLYMNVNGFGYFYNVGKYVIVGNYAGTTDPYLAISENMNEWEEIDTGYTEGSFTSIEYNELEGQYILAGLFDEVCLATTDLNNEKNIIDKMSTASDFSFRLETGSNSLLVKGNAKCTLTYRQKYLGV